MQLNSLYQQYNTFRTPDWRWTRVLKMCDRYPTPGRCTKFDDQYVRKAREFLLLWRKLDEATREQLFWKNPGLTYALDIYERAANGTGTEIAFIIEARLLARQDYETIAHEAGTLPDTIDWYEAMFFNVREHLDKRDWIQTQVLRPAFLRTKTEHADDNQAFNGAMTTMFRSSEIAKPFLDASLKTFAYFGGRFVIDHLIHGFRVGEFLESRDNLASWYDRVMGDILRRRSSQAAGQFEINKFNVTELFQVHHALMALEKSQDNIDAQKSTTERHIQALLEDIPWGVGEDGEMMLKGTKLGAYDERASVLRDHEVLRLSAGEELDVDDVLERLPPPRTKGPKLDTAGFTPPETKS